MKEGYYMDGVTRVTDPFYTCLCPAGHKVWSITYRRTCHVCGKRLSVCLPSDQYAERQKKSGQ